MLNTTLGDSVMIMYVVTIKQDDIIDKFYYTDETKADKTVTDNKFTGCEAVKETIQIND